MRNSILACAAGLLLAACVSVSADFDFGDEKVPEWSIAIHGGAGVITRN